MPDNRRSPIDEDIDRVARSLTAIPPRPAMREEIRAQIEPLGRGHAGYRLFGLAAAAATLVIILLVWPQRELVEQVPTPRQTATDFPRASEIAPPPDNSAPPTRASEGRTAGTRAARTPRATPAAVEPRLEIERLEVTPLEIEPVEVPMILVEGLDIEPLVVQ